MENQNGGDLRVPLVFAVFFLCVTAGGIFLIIYVFAPGISRPWFPAAALFLIGAPWIFWLLTYFYTITNSCCQPPAAADHHQVSRRPSTSAASSSSREPQNILFTNSV